MSLAKFERFGRENEGLKKQESNSFTEKDSLEEIDTLISPDSILDSIPDSIPDSIKN